MKSKILKLVIFVIFSSVLSGCAVKSVISRTYDFKDVTRIGILKIKSNNAYLDGTKDMFARELMRSGFTVVERPRNKKKTKEKDIATDDSIECKNTKKIGQVLGVKVLLMGDATYYPSEIKATDQIETEDVYIEPTFSAQRQQQADGTYRDVIVQSGQRISREERNTPGSYETSPKVGLIAKLVDVETAEIVWVGSTIKSGSTAMDAAESAVIYLVDNMSRDISRQKKK